MTAAPQRAVARTRPADLVCTCMRFHPHELLSRWQARAKITVRRLRDHGHAVDQRRVAETISRVIGIDRGTPASFSPANWARSHHLHDCPCSGHRTPLATLDTSPEAAWASR